MQPPPPELDAASWKTIASTWKSIAQVPLSQPDAALEVLWEWLEKLIDFDASYLVLSHRTERTRRAHGRGWVNGWLFTEFFYGAGDWGPVLASRQKNAGWIGKLLEHDPWLIHITQHTGSHRTILRDDIFNEEGWQTYLQNSPTGAIATRDRITSVFSVDQDVEVYLGFLRRHDRRFDERDRLLAHTLHTGLGHFWQRLVMSYGLLASQQRLAPRERDVLLLMLEGQSEADIASELQLAESTVHQYVVQVYRSFQISTRAELMAMWMGQGPLRICAE